MSSVNLLDLFDSKVFSCHGKTSELKTHPQMSWDKSMSTWGPFIYKVMGGLGEFMGGHFKNLCLLQGGQR